jgi:integrase
LPEVPNKAILRGFKHLPSVGKKPPAGGFTMTLLALARLYHNRVGGSPGYLEQLEVFVRRLDWQAEDLHPDRIDAYLTGALKHLAPSTVRNHRKMLRCLLHFAASERLVDASILRPLRRVKQIPPNPRAWSHAEIRSLLAVAANLAGGRKCPRAKLARAWILVAYSTGLRLEDLLSIRHDQIRGQRLCPSQHKVGWPHVCWLDDNALAAIRELPVLGPRIFGDLICRDKVMALMRQIRKAAGLPGSTKFLRRSGATYCEISGKDASGHLGHRSPGMKQYYVDRLLLAEEKRQEPTAPPLELVQNT